MENKKPLKTDKTENFSDKTKVDGSENSEKKLKDISNTVKETKQTNVLDNKEPLKTDKTENISDNTKKELKDISNTDKETYGQMLNNWLQWLKLSFWLLTFSKLNFFAISWA